MKGEEGGGKRTFQNLDCQDTRKLKLLARMTLLGKDTNIIPVKGNNKRLVKPYSETSLSFDAYVQSGLYDAKIKLISPLSSMQVDTLPI